MSELPALLEANRRFADAFDPGDQSILPRRKVAVICCVDPRIEPAALFGLRTGDAAIARIPGGRVTKTLIDDMLTASTVALIQTGVVDQVTDLIVIHHTKCGAIQIADDETRNNVARLINADESRLAMLAITTLEDSLATDVQTLRDDPRILETVNVSGYIYDVDTGLLREVVAPGS